MDPSLRWDDGVGVRSVRKIGWIVAILVLALDQLAKWLITGPMNLPELDSYEILPIFRLLWVANHGVSMGFLIANSDGQRWALAILTGAIALFVAYWLSREKRTMDSVALGLVLGGAAGNITDRVRLGYVTDFLNIHFGAWSPFYVFNIADAAISVGVALLVLRAFVTRDAPAPAEREDGQA
jgi:signal peptidase II